MSETKRKVKKSANKSKLPRFWMVYVEHGHSPTYQHSTEESARTEAARLAGQTGQRAWVLSASDYCERGVVRWKAAGAAKATTAKRNDRMTDEPPF